MTSFYSFVYVKQSRENWNLIIVLSDLQDHIDIYYLYQIWCQPKHAYDFQLVRQ